MPSADVEPTQGVDEQRQVDMRRYEEARQAGLDHYEACAWSHSQADIGVLRKLVREGCPVRLLARIVL